MSQLASALDLPYLPLDEPGFAVDPLPHFARARAAHPWLAKCAFGYLVHDYHAMKDLLAMDDKLRISMREVVEFMGATGRPWGKFMDEMMIAQGGALHQRLRGSVAGAFTPRSVNRHREVMRATVLKQLDEWAPKGAFDFAEFAANFPIRVMCVIIGASPDVVPRLRQSLETQGLCFSMDRALLPKLEQAFEVLWAFVDDLIKQREKSGASQGDLLDDMMAAQKAGDLSAYELRDLLIFLFAAGYDTSKNVLTLCMHEMLKHPEMWRRCGEDAEYAKLAVEETLRYHSPSNVPRALKGEIEYRDVRFVPGDVLFFPLTLSGRDPHVFPDADRFDPEREHVSRHLAFGRGAHICLGMYLARAQLEEGVHLIAQRLVNPRLAGDVAWRPFPGVWGIRSLPIAFERAH